MRVLFITGGSPAAIFDQAPLARAARGAGHEVLMAGPDAVTPIIAECGLPPVSISPMVKQQFTGVAGKPKEMPADEVAQMRLVGSWYAELTLDSMDSLHQLAADWRPDIVVGGALRYPAELLGHDLGIPTVLQPWGWLDTREYDAGALEVLRPRLAERGLDGLAEPTMRTEVIPPRFRPAGAAPSQSIRWVPTSRYRPLERWMYVRGERPRVLLTSGSRPTNSGAAHTIALESLREMAVGIAALDVELVLALPQAVAAEMRESLSDPRIHMGWTPLDVIAPTCDLLVHHGGSGTSMTALAAGVPQLVVREMPTVGEWQPLIDLGAVRELPKERHDPATVVATIGEMLANPAHAESAREVGREIEAMPLPAEVVDHMEKLL